MFTRNYLFISEASQKRAEEVKILLIGCGLGSQIGTLLARTGFYNFTIADGDVVDVSNLNRQNYSFKDVGQSKSEALKNTILGINPKAKVTAIHKFLKSEDLKDLIPKHDFIINSIDFDAEEFIVCHELCSKYKKTELFPINLGFGSAVFIFQELSFPRSPNIKKDMLEYIMTSPKSSEYIKTKAIEYSKLNLGYDPQLGVATYSNAALITTLVLKCINNEEVKSFPDFYFLDLHTL